MVKQKLNSISKFTEKKGKPKRSRPVPKAADLKKDEDDLRKEKRKSDAAKAPQIEIKEVPKSMWLVCFFFLLTN